MVYTFGAGIEPHASTYTYLVSSLFLYPEGDLSTPSGRLIILSDIDTCASPTPLNLGIFILTENMVK
jgi:hypothetical protein